MSSEKELNYDDPIEIASGIFWVGFFDRERNLHCNPYLIIDGDEAVVIDGGSRTDFPTVMMKILQTGIQPKQIIRLIYHHYDPDLCSSIPNFEDIIGSPELKLISHKENNVFIRYYSVNSKMLCITAIDYQFSFSSGRMLQFLHTPYSHSAGSFVTFDEKSGTLFSSDIFGSYDKNWNLFVEFSEECRTCSIHEPCALGKSHCPFIGIHDFHRRIMTSNKALRHALTGIESLPLRRIAPQHGSIIHRNEDIALAIEKLRADEEIGIDGIIEKP